MRGPPPQPTHLRLVRGNPSKRPLPADEPKPEIGIPQMPKTLSKEARAVWKEVAAELNIIGVITTIDEKALTAFAETFATWQQAIKEIRKRGIMVRTQLGTLQQNPAINIANSAQKDMLNIMKEFGMTPSSRTRIKIENPKRKKNRFAEINE